MASLANRMAGFADEAGADLDTQIRALKELGWTAIETRMAGKVHFDDLDDQAFETARARLKEAGIRIVCYGSQIANWARPVSTDFTKDTDELRRIMPRMRKTGTHLVRIMSYPNDGLAKPDWKKEVLRRLRELTRMAEDEGVILCHENCSGLAGEGPAETLEMLSEINSPALKLIFDTGNPVEKKQASFDYYRAVADHVVHVHIKDYVADPTCKNGVRAVFPGEGQGEVKKILADLKARQYKGFFTIEPHIAAVAHENKGPDNSAYDVFVKYGKLAQALAESA